MKTFLGVTLGALLLAAPAIAFAGSSGGGGGLAGSGTQLATGVLPGAEASQPNLSFASAGTTSATSSSTVAQDITAISEALSGRDVSAFNSATLLANHKGGGR